MQVVGWQRGLETLPLVYRINDLTADITATVERRRRSGCLSHSLRMLRRQALLRRSCSSTAAFEPGQDAIHHKPVRQTFYSPLAPDTR
ncbi:hypothetical protein GGE12_001945 [Rhizobium mongolense]|uniref:Uncharacterized protein n=1 Tax=Rhizobium mongolense TaxID=57676 RepID=A0A7W6WDV5_9HYPH|nr:hypothetical protein [Rhizobium mongolense]